MRFFTRVVKRIRESEIFHASCKTDSRKGDISRELQTGVTNLPQKWSSRVGNFVSGEYASCEDGLYLEYVKMVFN